MRVLQSFKEFDDLIKDWRFDECGHTEVDSGNLFYIFDKGVLHERKRIIKLIEKFYKDDPQMVLEDLEDEINNPLSALGTNVSTEEKK